MSADDDVAAFEKTLHPDECPLAGEIVRALTTLAGAGLVRPHHVQSLVDREEKSGASAARLAACKRIGDAWIAFRATAPLPANVAQALSAAKSDRERTRFSNPWFKAVNAVLAIVLLFGLRVGFKVYGRGCLPGGSQRAVYDPRDLSFDQGAVQTKLPEGWKAEHGDPALRHFGPGLFTSRIARKDDGTTANLGVASVAQTKLPKGIEDDALIDAVFEPFKKAVYDHLHVVTEWSRADCGIQDRAWIVCGGTGTSRYESTPYTVYLHLKRFGDNYLVAIFFQRTAELSRVETIDFVKTLDL